MTRIPNRVVRVRIGKDLLFREWTQDLDMIIKVTKTIDKKPNQANIKLYNLAEESTGLLEEPNLTVQVLAGEDIAGGIFNGNTLKKGVKTMDLQPGKETIIMAGEGKIAYQDDTIYKQSWPPNSNRDDIVTDLLSKKGINKGYIDSRIPTKAFVGPMTFFHPVRVCLDMLYGEYLWSFENNALNVYLPDSAQIGNALKIDSSTLFGTPSRNDVGVTVKTDLWPDAECGKGFELDSKFLKGTYRIEKIVHDVSSTGLIWYSTLSGKRV